MKVTKDDGEWLEGIIVDGQAEYLPETCKVEGESITIKKSLCRFEKIASAEKQA